MSPLLKSIHQYVKLTPARFAKDDDVLLGETVIALGIRWTGGSVSGILSSKIAVPPAGEGRWCSGLAANRRGD